MSATKDVLSVLIKESVQSKFEDGINAIIEEKYKKHVKEEDEEEDMDDSDDDEDEDSDEDEDDSDDSDEELEESMKVEYLEKGAYTHGSKVKKTETTTINRHADLVKMANTGKYEWFLVTKKDGTEIEYNVDFEGKKPVLVEM